MWYCRIANSTEVVGPLSDEQLRSMAREGRLQPSDAVAQAAHGPWYPASHVRGLFPRSESVRSPTPAKPSATPIPATPASGGSPSPSQASGTVVTPELLAKWRVQRRKQARKLTKLLLGVGVGLMVLFILVLIRPVISSIFQAATAKRAKAVPSHQVARNLQDSKSAELVASIPGLNEVLGHASSPTESSGAGAETNRESRVARLTRLIAASQAFGTTAQKVRDSHGHVEMGIEECQIAPVALRQGGIIYKTARPYLIFKLRVRNTSSSDAVNYQSPRQGYETAEVWWDKARETTPPWQQRGMTLDGQVENVTLEPGQELVDAFAFQAPPEGFRQLYIRIPGRSVNLAEDFLFVISENDVRRPQEVAQTASAEASGPDSIGPMSGTRPSEAVSAQGESLQGDMERPNEDEEAIPIPGISDAQGPSSGEAGMSEEDRAKLEELRKRGEAMQDTLDRQRENRRPSGSRPQSPKEPQ